MLYCYIAIWQVMPFAPMSSTTSTVSNAATPALPPVDMARHHLDRVGAAGSLICAAHCALWPFALALIPGLGLSFLASPLFERGFVVFAGVLATLSLLPGWRRHGSPVALMVLLPGLIGVGVGAFSSSGHGGWLHAVLMSFGGMLIGAAHLTNLSLLRRRSAMAATDARP